MILEAKKLQKIYGGKKGSSQTEALHYVDLTIEKGDFVVIMGPSGSGKTTLLNILNGFDYPTSGKVNAFENDIFAMNQDELALFRRKNLGFVFQSYHLLDSLTIRENIMLPMVLDKKEKGLMQQRADYLMQLFGIEEVGEKYPYQVSGGQQQRAAISRALINETKILFADEPTGNLDSKSAKTVMNSFVKANEENETTIVMVTHDPFAASFSNRVIFLKDGRIVSESVKKDTREDFFKSIINHLAVLEGEAYDI